MKSITIAILTTIFLLASTFISCSNKKEEALVEKSFVSISKENPRYFEFENKTWVPVMINFIMPNGEPEQVFQTVERYFKNFSANGGNAVRIWISSPFLEIEDKKQGQYNPEKFKRIDTVISLAKKYGIKIKFTLQHIRTISPKEAGNALWSNSEALCITQGGSFKNINEYVDTPQGRIVYMNRIKALAEKYKDNEQIFGWELWNEMDALGSSDWYSFSTEILPAVKNLFPNHLVSQTLGSLHSEDAEQRYDKMFILEVNEYINVHRYLDPGTDWEQYDLVRQPADRIASTAVSFAYSKVDNLPILMNEIGAVEANHAGPSKLYPKDTLGILLHDMVFAPYFNGAAGCGAMWHWNDYIYNNNLWWHYQRFNEAVSSFDPAAEGFEPFYTEKDHLRVYGLRGKHHTLIWCRDGRNNWQTELIEGIAPEFCENFSLKLSDFNAPQIQSVKTYDPWTATTTELSVVNGQFTFPNFSRSIVVVLSHDSRKTR
ncbi:MAG: cellulase family glycosylhydrolase [Draconibacterium sp.]